MNRTRTCHSGRDCRSVCLSMPVGHVVATRSSSHRPSTSHLSSLPGTREICSRGSRGCGHCGLPGSGPVRSGFVGVCGAFTDLWTTVSDCGQLPVVGSCPQACPPSLHSFRRVVHFLYRPLTCGITRIRCECRRAASCGNTLLSFIHSSSELSTGRCGPGCSTLRRVTKSTV